MRLNRKYLAVCVVALPLTGFAQQRAATGPVESVQLSSFSTITVLGQTFSLTSETKFSVNGRQVALAKALNALAGDEDVYIEGLDFGAATKATVVSVSRAGRYVSGATPVYVLGAVEEISLEEGLIRLRSLQIDSSTISPDKLAAIKVGSLIEVSGVQPLSGGKIVDVELLSVGGSGLQLQSVGGSGALKQSVGGSGAQLQSVGGSGALKQSVGGSGVQLQSVGGSGALKESVGGSGSQLQSVGGSGMSLQSNGDTITQLRSVGGSGK